MKRRYLMFIRLSQFRIFVTKLFISLTLLSAICLVILSKVHPAASNYANGRVISFLSPLIHMIQLPADGAFYLTEKIKNIFFIYEENKYLKYQNEQIDRLLIKLRSLETENALLSDMLNYSSPSDMKFITAKVIAGINDAFSHSIIVYIPNASNIRLGQIAMYKEEVIGRVDLINGSYARVLLITDISSKIPVIIKRSRERAILSGNNTSVMNLLYTIPAADIKAGDQVVTSGVGGIFPSDLLIGYVTKVTDHIIEVKPSFPINKIEYIQIIDYYSDAEILPEDIR